MLVTGDCFLKWIYLQSNVAQTACSDLAMKAMLTAELNKRSETFLKTPALIACLMYDPRIKWLMNGNIFNPNLFDEGWVGLKKIIFLF